MSQALLVSAAMFASACGEESPASPSPLPSAAPTLTGVWEVTYTGRFGSGCRTSGSGTRTTVFRLSQQGETVTGTIFDVDVTGSVSAGSTDVPLTGMTTQFGYRSQVRATIRPNSDFTGFTGPLVAALSQGGTGLSVCGASIDAQITEARRVPYNSASTNFTGVWEGQFGVQDCTTINWTYCYPVMRGEMSLFYADLVQTGSSVSGRMVLHSGVLPAPAPEQDIHVTGTVNGNQLTLRGALTSPDGRHTLEITDWATARDEFGRMTGTFTYVESYLVFGTQLNSTTSHNVLVGVELR